MRHFETPDSSSGPRMWAWVRIPLLTQYCVTYEVTSSSNTIGVQLQMIQYIFRIKVLSKDTPSFRRRDWLKKMKDTIRLKYDAV